jgi:hypothetical protein
VGDRLRSNVSRTLPGRPVGPPTSRRCAAPSESYSDVILRLARGRLTPRQNLDEVYETPIFGGRAVAFISVMEVMKNAASTINLLH